MRAPSAAELLDAWERGRAQPPHRRALVLLEFACPGTEPDALLRLSLGRRDRLLLALRGAWLGDEMVARASCPGCWEALEFPLRASVLGVAPSREADQEPLSFSVDGYDVAFRLPNSLDLEAAAAEPDPEAARAALLDRCLLSVARGGGVQEREPVPEPVALALAEEMERTDPQAGLQLRLDCPACRLAWEAPFDIASFLWNELEARALRLFEDVHTLASAYGWSEKEILAMSPARRNAYLEIVRR